MKVPLNLSFVEDCIREEILLVDEDRVPVLQHKLKLIQFPSKQSGRERALIKTTKRGSRQEN